MKFRLNCEPMELRDTPAVFPVDPSDNPPVVPPGSNPPAQPAPQPAPTEPTTNPTEPYPMPNW